MGCFGPDNLVEVLCLDTNLVLKWKKYIKVAPTVCSYIGYVEVCHNAPGIIVSGSSYDMNDPQNSSLYVPFIYRLDSATVAGVADNAETEAIDRVNVYPNPANDIIQFSERVNIKLLDLSGKEVVEKQGINSLDIKDYQPGFYFVFFYDKDGQIIQREKVVKK
jgi:hypothetical protein